MKFLDSAFETYGPNSAAYMSLGTSAWPVNRPRLVDLIINSLLEIEPPLPFVFVKGSNDLPHGLGEKVETMREAWWSIGHPRCAC